MKIIALLCRAGINIRCGSIISRIGSYKESTGSLKHVGKVRGIALHNLNKRIKLYI
jgi:hypothetical protein